MTNVTIQDWVRKNITKRGYVSLRRAWQTFESVKGEENKKTVESGLDCRLFKVKTLGSGKDLRNSNAGQGPGPGIRKV